MTINLTIMPPLTYIPIDDAPKDGTEILAYNVTHKHWKLVEYHATVDTEGWCVMGINYNGAKIVNQIYNEHYFQLFIPLSALGPTP